jgi:hypothetical protein
LWSSIRKPDGAVIMWGGDRPFQPSFGSSAWFKPKSSHVTPVCDTWGPKGSLLHLSTQVPSRRCAWEFQRGRRRRGASQVVLWLSPPSSHLPVIGGRLYIWKEKPWLSVSALHSLSYAILGKSPSSQFLPVEHGDQQVLLPPLEDAGQPILSCRGAGDILYRTGNHGPLHWHGKVSTPAEKHAFPNYPC